MASSSPARKEPNRFSTLEGTTQRPPPAPDEMATQSHNPDSCGTGYSLSPDQPRHARLQWLAEQDGEKRVFQSPLPLALLMDIAGAIDNREQCIRLAIKLKLGEDELLKVLDGKFTVQVPLNILSTWKDRYRHHATGPVLYAAFCEMERADLADRFKDKLLGQSDVTAQSAMEMTPPLQPAVTEETDISQMKPSLDVLVEIAFSLPKLKHSIRLAESLQLEAQLVEQLKTSVFKADMAALNVLCRWRQQRSREVTGRALYDALIAIRCRDIAACCAGHLLGKEEDDWEDFCFDGEHRNFFRTLRRRQIDVLSAYEGMHCSEDFLSCLNRWGILEHSEYEDLLSSSHGLLRSAVNKRLLNAVNQKPSQLQEVFTELLCRHQPHLLKKNEEGSSVLSEISSDEMEGALSSAAASHHSAAASPRKVLVASPQESIRPPLGLALCFDDPELFNITKQAGFTPTELRHFAAILLNESGCKLSGDAFLNDLDIHVYTCVSSQMHALLVYWIKGAPPPTYQRYKGQLKHAFLEMERGDMILQFKTYFDGGSHHLTSVVLVDSPWQLQGEDLLVDFKNELHRRFNQLVMARPLDFVACDSEPVSEVYVTLSSISYEEALKLVGSPKELCGSELLKAASQVAAESKHSKELLDLYSLLRYPQGMQAKSALLFGSAGSGKSLTVLKILSEWNSQSSASPFQQFDVIIHITGRQRSRINAKEVHDLWQLWQMGYSEEQQQCIITHYAHHSEKVLFLVDAWDEAGEEGLLGEDTVLKKILLGNLFLHSSVIITSRPAPNAYPLLEDCKRHYSLVGFTNERLRELFDRRLEKPRASGLYEALSQPSYLHVKSAVQKTPLFAAMLVQLNKMEETLPTAITDLYQSMLTCIRRRYVQWVKDTRFGNQSKTMTFDKNSATADFDRVETRLGKLALAGWMSNKVSFSEEEASACGKIAIKPEFGLLSEVQEIGVLGSSRVLYHFSHLTWQEYLAARNLTGDPQFIKKLRLCVRSIGVGEHTQLFWRFVAGLVDSHLVPTMMLEVVKATGIAGFAPWETEVRLFLLECIAEHIRMQDLSEQQLVTTQYIQLAAEALAVRHGQFVFSGCVLDANRLSAIALVLRFCANIYKLFIDGIHVNHHCPSLAPALDHVEHLEVANISGPKTTSFLTAIFSSLTGSSSIRVLICTHMAFTRECLSAFSELINNCKSLTEVQVSRCDFGLSSVAFLNQTIRPSSALSTLVLLNTGMLAGAGRELGEICSRMPRLQKLEIIDSRLGNSDIAGLLAGLQNSCYLQWLHVESNVLTDDVAVPLVQFAARRAYLAEQVHESFQVNLPELNVYVAGNELSEDMLRNLAVLLPEKCCMAIVGNHHVVRQGRIDQRDHALTLKVEMDSSPDGHVVFVYPGAGDLGAVQIAQFLTTGYGQLASLTLCRCDIGDHGAATIAGAVSSTRLQGLDISRNHITFIGFHQLMSALPGQDALMCLSLSCNPIFASCGLLQSQWMPSILSLSLSIHCLQIVSMSSTKFSDEINCFENSPLALMAIPSLSALDLSNNEITSRSVPILTEWMDKVEYLSLSGNRITSEGSRKLIERAQVLRNRVSGHQMSGCRLQRIWLGGNDIKPSVFTDCRSETISSESFSLLDVVPRYVHDLLSSAAGSSHYSRQLPLETSRQRVHLKFWLRMNRVVHWGVFWDCMDHIVQSHDKAAFNFWLRVVIEALANADGSSQPQRQADVLRKVFVTLAKWYSVEKNVPMIIAAQCCSLAIMNEMVLTFPNSVCKPIADQTMEVIARNCSLDSDILCLAVECLSGLAERYRRRQLHSVADKLLQRLEYVSQYAWSVMHSY